MLRSSFPLPFATVLTILIVIFFPAIWLPAQGLEDLVQQAEHEIAKSPMNQAQWGLLALDLETGEKVLGLDDEKLFMPASNRKLFSTAFALETLGSDYTFSTKLEYSGTLNLDGELDGDLIVRASGDPTISEKFRKDHSPTGVFEDWADKVKLTGIERVKGNLVIDLSCFSESTRLGEGWSWDYESDYYSAPVGAFSFNENVVFVKVSPGKSGEQCRVDLYPEADGFILRNETVTSSKANTIRATRAMGSNIIIVKGTLPPGSETEFNPIAVDDPCRFAAEALKAVLKKKGIEIVGEVVPTYASPAAQGPQYVIAEYVSPPLSEIIKQINQNSNNQLAEMIYLTAGRIATGSPASYARSREGEMKFWQRIKLADASRLYAADGSGLSRRNLFTPRAFCDLLRKMRERPEAEAFVASLAINGRNGTLSGRMSAIPEHIVGKTGTIANVSCLSGYLINSDDRTLVFSILVNHFTCPTSSIKATQDKLCQLLVNETIQPMGVALNGSETLPENGG